MGKALHIVLAMLVIAVSTHVGWSRDLRSELSPSAGVFNSIKGVGATVRFPSGMEFGNISLYAEIYGIPTGRCSTPGVKLCYSHNIILKGMEFETARLSFYAGPGVSVGYMRDAEIGKYEGTDFTLARNSGFMAALSGTGGCLFNFSRNIALDLSFTAELGIHVRRDEKVHSLNMNFYRNGLLQALYPQLSILFYL